jgi:hypothetical protein
MQPDKKKESEKDSSHGVQTPQPPQIINPSSPEELEEKKKSVDKKSGRKK